MKRLLFKSSKWTISSIINSLICQLLELNKIVTSVVSENINYKFKFKVDYSIYIKPYIFLFPHKSEIFFKSVVVMFFDFFLSSQIVFHNSKDFVFEERKGKIPR